MNSMLFERLALSRDKEGHGTGARRPGDAGTGRMVKDPYVLEFLGLPNQNCSTRKNWKSALLEHLQKSSWNWARGFLSLPAKADHSGRRPLLHRSGLLQLHPQMLRFDRSEDRQACPSGPGADTDVRQLLHPRADETKGITRPSAFWETVEILLHPRVRVALEIPERIFVHEARRCDACAQRSAKPPRPFCQTQSLRKGCHHPEPALLRPQVSAPVEADPQTSHQSPDLLFAGHQVQFPTPCSLNSVVTSPRQPRGKPMCRANSSAQWMTRGLPNVDSRMACAR